MQARRKYRGECSITISNVCDKFRWERERERLVLLRPVGSKFDTMGDRVLLISDESLFCDWLN